MFGYILLAIAMITMIAVIGGAIVSATSPEVIDMEVNEQGDFVEVVLVK